MFLRSNPPRPKLHTSLAKERKAMPVNLPLVVGNTSPTALAAPVALGMMLQEAARPPRQSWRIKSKTSGYTMIEGVFIQMCGGGHDSCENGGEIGGGTIFGITI